MEQNKFDIKEYKTNEEKRQDELKEKFRSLRMYVRITSIISNLIGTIILGIVVGYFVSQWQNNNDWMAISIIVFSLIAIVGFYMRVVKFK